MTSSWEELWGVEHARVAVARELRSVGLEVGDLFATNIAVVNAVTETHSVQVTLGKEPTWYVSTFRIDHDGDTSGDGANVAYCQIETDQPKVVARTVKALVS